ncbi:phosphate acyltransferase PlsX [Alicyclobacillus ferrooxydans]|uniref:Phosphate acyltransferase n=1 Tax=Alicyclobacillus ferrooxydans TaxID=471514 RepID=A0A0N8PPV3_9BACL|nr:phosphate acyltransferase PlsX [Alicyclobacillus ferrooxydans]KPV45365.1 phosphate acyltransferase [Alicyclobacillus ferrooxydans]
MKLAIDAMGGDLAPVAPVHATIECAAKFSDTEFILIGHEAKIREAGGTFPANVRVVHTDVTIETGDEPVRAVRRKPNSSLVMAATMVKESAADVMLSAGSTGALVASGLLAIGRLQGIDRPALAPVLPTFNGKGVLLLDAGATMDANAHNLLQYAQMGCAYSRQVRDIPNPRVALLNVGTEPGKGNALTKEAFQLLESSSLDFVGNIEAREVLDGDADVVVCDGFVGNVVLKLIEGVGLGIFGLLKEQLTSSFTSKLGAVMLKPSLRGIRDKFDYAEYGAAPFLGVNGGCLKAHGSSSKRAWVVALEQARKFAAQDLIGQFSHELKD